MKWSNIDTFILICYNKASIRYRELYFEIQLCNKNIKVSIRDGLKSPDRTKPYHDSISPIHWHKFN